MELHDLTIIVPTRNELGNVPALLASLPPTVELMVVDASTDETPDLILKLRPERTQVMRYPARISEARQLGARAAQTRWLLFTDADVIFAPDYFERLVAYDGDALYGPKLSRDQYAWYYRLFSGGQAVCDRLGIPAASGSNLLVRREVFWDSGGFDLDLSCNEDSELAWRIKQHGHRVRFARDLIVYARDHRRLRLGLTRKTLHSVVRCGLLFSGLMPRRWRSRDWGYWKHVPPTPTDRAAWKKEALWK